MTTRSIAKAELQLRLDEAALRENLLSVLPAAAKTGAPLFTNSRFNPQHLPIRREMEPSEHPLRSAEQCIAQREDLGMPIDGSVGQLFISACEESASVNPHRRGPRNLATWLLTQLAVPA